MEKEKHIFKNTAYNLPKTGFSKELVERTEEQGGMRSLFVGTAELKSYSCDYLSDKINVLEFKISRETGMFVLNPVKPFDSGIHSELKNEFRKKKESMLVQLRELNEMSVEILSKPPLELMNDHELLGEVKLIMELMNHCEIKTTD